MWCLIRRRLLGVQPLRFVRRRAQHRMNAISAKKKRTDTVIIAALAPGEIAGLITVSEELIAKVWVGKAEDDSSDIVEDVGLIVGKLSVSKVRTVMTPASIDGFGRISSEMREGCLQGRPSSSRLTVS